MNEELERLDNIDLERLDRAVAYFNDHYGPKFATAKFYKKHGLVHVEVWDIENDRCQTHNCRSIGAINSMLDNAWYDCQKW